MLPERLTPRDESLWSFVAPFDAVPAEIISVPIGRDGNISLSAKVAEWTGRSKRTVSRTLRDLPNRGGDQDFSPKELASIVAPPVRKDVKVHPLLAEAAAIRQAGEIREHVEDIRPFDGVMYWTETEVYLLEVDWPEETDSAGIRKRQTEHGDAMNIDIEDPREGRYYKLHSAADDYEIITLSDAKEKAKYDTYVSLGKVPNDLVVSAAICERSVPELPVPLSGAGHGTQYVMTVIEFCCGKDSKTCDERYELPGKYS